LVSGIKNYSDALFRLPQKRKYAHHKFRGWKKLYCGDKKMSFKEYCSKNLENIICFGAAGAMVLIGIIAFVCIYCSK
jgi:hypothetical protein